MPYRLLTEFEDLFRGKRFLHRRPHQGDVVASQLYEDLYELGRSKSYVKGIDGHLLGINSGNRITGQQARRGDGTFGEFVPNLTAVVVQNFHVARGHLASLQIGAETKIFNAALGKQQIERVGDLNGQASAFRRHNSQAVCVAIIGINFAPHYAAYEGERVTKTDGVKYKHPAQEAPKMAELLEREVRPNFDEFILLRYRATNDEPFPFEWVNEELTSREYGAALVRLSNLYQSRFGGR